MSSVGPNYPSSGASLANSGTSESANAWANPGNVGSSSAVASITAATFDSPDISEILVASNFGFAIDTSATITGITVEISKRGYTSANSGKDYRVQLSTGTAFANLVGDNKASASVWPQTTLATTTYGGTTDHWNAGLSVAQVNAAGFAVFLSAYANVANADIEVDWVRVTVEYTTPPHTDATSNAAAAGTGDALADTASIEARGTTSATSTGEALTGLGSVGATATVAESTGTAIDATADAVDGSVTFTAEAAAEGTGLAILVNASLTASAGYARARSA